MGKHVVHISDEKELLPLAEYLLKLFSGKRIFVLYGNLGAGKTTFIKRFCNVLGVQNTIQSPTFAIINEYSSPKYGPVYHMDFYRIEKPEEAYDIGLEEYLDSGNYCFIEWPEKIESLLPADIVNIRIRVDTGQTRIIEVDNGSYPDI
ncbi:MAG: tRNA (adenosine(37)-N6)-threonylcarbamoyltransferase complex ATPase subunit type 1 TsaE [Bacteroidales bacterium]|nr:tRNA (adenosine(37)-N6)-threonylcarbamoyltransferase complex ATPase subunit type 1 TsaE [Bacteroidales bacterium]